MKKLISLISVFTIILLLASCSDDKNNPASSEDLSLDNSLIGKWVYVDSNNDELSYTFNSDGTCTQIIYNQNFSWKWTIEDGKLKFYIDGGTPAYYDYRIDGNQLYLWVDAINDWGFPFTKQ